MLQKIVLNLFVLLCVIATTHAHICLVNPHQRGALNISDGGDPTCFRHGAPCGGQATGPSLATLVAGANFTFFWQQNYNHYTVGFPGYMDIAWAQGSNPSDNQFQILATLSDYNPHWQGSQQNFSTTVTIPLVECNPCVIRARYVPHKPGEDIFYQCADVTITTSVVDSSTADSNPSSSSSSSSSSSNSMHELSPILPSQSEESGVVIYALNPVSDTDLQLIQVDTTSGQTHPVMNIPLRIRSDKSKTIGNITTDPFVLDQIAAVDASTQTIYYMASDGGLESVSKVILAIQPLTLSLHRIPLPTLTTPINALNFDPNTRTLIALSMEASSTPGSFITHVLRIDPSDSTITHILDTTADDTYINFQWSVINAEENVLYALYQNENAADSMDSIIITVDLSQSLIKQKVTLDVSQYTVSIIHLDYLFQTSNLLSVSPGLTQGDDNWSLVSVNPTSGEIKFVQAIAASGTFDRYYGAAVYDGSQKNTFYHTFRHNNAFTVATTTSSQTTFSPPIALPNMHNRVAMLV